VRVRVRVRMRVKFRVSVNWLGLGLGLVSVLELELGYTYCMNCVKYDHVLLTCNLINCVNLIRKALQTLQVAGGSYCLVAHEDRDVRASSRGFQEANSLRVLRPQDNEGAQRQEQEAARDPGFEREIVWDVPVGKAMSMLKVTACWHEIAFKNQIGFTESNFLY
jgi:hypothetical protein